MVGKGCDGIMRYVRTEKEGAEWSHHTRWLSLLCPLGWGISASPADSLWVFFAVPEGPLQVVILCPSRVLWGSVKASLSLLRNPITSK